MFFVWHLRRVILAAMIALALIRDSSGAASSNIKVVDDQGNPVSRFDVMIATADDGHSKWNEGRDGIADFDKYWKAQVIDVLVRAEGFASTVVRFAGENRDQLLAGDAKVTLQAGQEVELRFRLLEGLTWPANFIPDVYFVEQASMVEMMWQPANRKETMPDFNMLNIKPIEAARYKMRIAEEMPPFYVGVNSPGFLQFFKSGPYTLKDVKQGILEIELPQLAGLDVHFDSGSYVAEFPFKGVSIDVLKYKQPGKKGMLFKVASANQTALKLNDLPPGEYMIFVRTQSKSGDRRRANVIDSGAFYDTKTVVLKAGQAERVDFRYAPVDLDAFRGNRTAVLHILNPDGSPAIDRQINVGFFDGHYGAVPVFSGKVPESGEIVLKDITDRHTIDQLPYQYEVKVDDKNIGGFGFTPEKGNEEFTFHLAPDAGDMAPDIDLVNINTGKSIKLNQLRGKVVWLEFWATWCGPCQPAVAKLSELAKEQKDTWKDTVVLLPLSIDEESDQPKQHAMSRGWDNLDHYWAGGDAEHRGFYSPAMRAFVQNSVPTAILIDAEGRIVWRGHPMFDKDGQDVKQRIEAALKKGS